MKLNPVSLLQAGTNYLKEVRHELTMVSWPTRQQTIRMTIMVMVISVIIGLYVGGLDFLFTRLIQLVLR